MRSTTGKRVWGAVAFTNAAGRTLAHGAVQPYGETMPAMATCSS